jgi:uncharacterized protein (TIGR02246 family)
MGDAMHEVLDRWTAAFNSHQTEAMAELFAADALFQGFGLEVLSGQAAVRGYYEAVPEYRSAVDVSVLHSYEIGDQVTGGFADVTFRDPSGWEARVHLSLVLQQGGDGWQIRQYHVSRVSDEH